MGNKVEYFHDMLVLYLPFILTYLLITTHFNTIFEFCEVQFHNGGKNQKITYL